MTETPPSIIGLISNGCGGWRLWSRDDGDKPGEADASYVPTTALEAAQARVRELEEHLESDLTAAYLAGQKAARREALEEAAKVADAETGWIGEPYQSNMDFGPNVGPRIATTIRALMENPNG